LGDERARAVVSFLAPIARTHLVALLGPDGLAGVILADLLPWLRHRAIAGHRHLLHVLFVDGAARRPGHRHLVLLPDWFAHRVAAFADVLLIDRSAGGVAHRHLVFLPARPTDGVAALADVLLVDGAVRAVVLRNLVFLPARFAHRIPALAHVLLVNRLADRVLAGDVIGLPHRFANGVAAFADVLLVNRFAHRIPAFLHDGVVNRAIADAGLIFQHGAIANAVTHSRQAALL